MTKQTDNKRKFNFHILSSSNKEHTTIRDIKTDGARATHRKSKRERDRKMSIENKE